MLVVQYNHEIDKNIELHQKPPDCAQNNIHLFWILNDSQGDDWRKWNEPFQGKSKAILEEFYVLSSKF